MARAYRVHAAKAKLSEILRHVRQGQSVTISDRGRAIARVVPIEPARDLPTRLAMLEQDGIIVAGKGSPTTIRPITRRRGALGRFLRSRA